MQAIVINEFGGYDVFETAELPDPTPSAGEVRIRVAASSVNPLELKIRSGLVPAAPAFPAILNADVSGIIDQVGEGVTKFKVGDAVIGCAGGIKSRQGALADFMVTDARLIEHAPKSLGLEEAASLPLVFMTAWSALIERLQISSGDHLLIHGGAGGVGHVAIQLAKAKGAEVSTTVSSEEKAQVVRDLGADHVIHYQSEKVEDYTERLTQGQGFTHIFDTVGGASLDASLQAASPFGQIATINARSSHDLSLMHSKSLTLHAVFRALPLLTGQGIEGEPARLAALVQMVDEGKVLPLIAEQRFTFEQIGQAHAYLESGKALGKILLTRH